MITPVDIKISQVDIVRDKIIACVEKKYACSRMTILYQIMHICSRKLCTWSICSMMYFELPSASVKLRLNFCFIILVIVSAKSKFNYVNFNIILLRHLTFVLWPIIILLILIHGRIQEVLFRRKWFCFPGESWTSFFRNFAMYILHIWIFQGDLTLPRSLHTYQ